MNTDKTFQSVRQASARAISRQVAEENERADSFAPIMALLREELAHEYATFALQAVRSCKERYKQEVKNRCNKAQRKLSERINYNVLRRGEDLTERLDEITEAFRSEKRKALEGLERSIGKAFAAHGSKYPEVLAKIHLAHLLFFAEGNILKQEKELYPYAQRIRLFFSITHSHNRVIEGNLKQLYVEFRRRDKDTLHGLPALAAKYQKQVEAMFYDYKSAVSIFNRLTLDMQEEVKQEIEQQKQAV